VKPGTPVYKRVQKVAHIEGVGDVPITLVQAEFRGKTFQAATRKECGEWVKAQRKVWAKQQSEQKEADRLARELEQADKIYPVLTERLHRVATQIKTLSKTTTMEERHVSSLDQMAEAIFAMVLERQEKEKEEKESDTAEEAAQ
jgi:hypothetical protein